MNTEEKKSDALKYLRVNARDEEWGIVITTVGYQYVSPNHAYPLSKHPDNYNFKNEGKRTLNEYQLVYITRGEGYFSSRSCPKTHIEAGTMLLLFPGEWHKYYPDARTGWDEHWVGFRISTNRIEYSLTFVRKRVLQRFESLVQRRSHDRHHQQSQNHDEGRTNRELVSRNHCSPIRCRIFSVSPGI